MQKEATSTRMRDGSRIRLLKQFTMQIINKLQVQTGEI